MGLFTAALALMALGATTYNVVGQRNNRPQTPQMPKAPTLKDAEGVAFSEADQRRRAAARSKTLHTSPLGIQGEADVARKTLLGQ